MGLGLGLVGIGRVEAQEVASATVGASPGFPPSIGAGGKRLNLKPYRFENDGAIPVPCAWTQLLAKALVRLIVAVQVKLEASIDYGIGERGSAPLCRNHGQG